MPSPAEFAITRERVNGDDLEIRPDGTINPACEREAVERARGDDRA